MLISHVECENHHYTLCFLYAIIFTISIIIIIIIISGGSSSDCGVVAGVIGVLIVKYESLHSLIFCNITVCCFTTFSELGHYRHDMDYIPGL